MTFRFGAICACLFFSHCVCAQRVAPIFETCQEAQDAAIHDIDNDEMVFYQFGCGPANTSTPEQLIMDSLALVQFSLRFKNINWRPTIDCYNEQVAYHLDSINGGKSFYGQLINEMIVILNRRE